MADIKQIKVGNTIYDIDAKTLEGQNGAYYLNYNNLSNKPEFAKPEQGIYYIVGTGTTAGTWTGSHADITAYYDGLTIAYRTNIAGAATTTLNINELGAKTCYLRGTTKVTTQYSVDTVVLFTYITVSGKGRWVTADYDSNSYAYVRQYVESENSELPIIMSHDTEIPSSYKTKYTGVVSGVTLNPSTKTISATAFKENGTALSSKYVAQVSGKGLSTNDYTTAEKNKLAGLSNYSLPTATSNTLGGVKIGSNITNSSGTISVTSTNVTGALGYTPANATDLANKADVYAISGLKFNGLSSVNQTLPNNTDNKTIIGVIDNGNTGIISTNADSWNTRIYYSDNITALNLTMLLFEDGAVNNVGFSFGGSTIVWNESNLSNTYYDSATIIALKNAFVEDARAVLIDCESNYTELQKKADIYVIESADKLSKVKVGTNLSGKTLTFDGTWSYGNNTDIITFANGYQIKCGYSSAGPSSFGLWASGATNPDVDFGIVYGPFNGWEMTSYTFSVDDGFTITDISGDITGVPFSEVSLNCDALQVDCESNYNEIQALKRTINNSSGGSGLYKHNIQISTGSNYYVYVDVYTSSDTLITTASQLFAILGTKYTAGSFNGADGYGAVTFYFNSAGTAITIYGAVISGTSVNVINLSTKTVGSCTDTVKQV